MPVYLLFFSRFPTIRLEDFERTSMVRLFLFFFSNYHSFSYLIQDWGVKKNDFISQKIFAPLLFLIPIRFDKHEWKHTWWKWWGDNEIVFFIARTLIQMKTFELLLITEIKNTSFIIDQFIAWHISKDN